MAIVHTVAMFVITRGYSESWKIHELGMWTELKILTPWTPSVFEHRPLPMAISETRFLLTETTSFHLGVSNIFPLKEGSPTGSHPGDPWRSLKIPEGLSGYKICGSELQSQDVQAFSDFLFYVLGNHVPSSEKPPGVWLREIKKTSTGIPIFFCGTSWKFGALYLLKLV